MTQPSDHPVRIRPPSTDEHDIEESMRIFLFIGMISCLLSFVQCQHKKSLSYSGTPFSDSIYSDGPQIIPGKIQNEYFDLGGEGMTYHDTDSTNSGSGRLNPADGSYLHEFRISEAVDISYTKVDDREIDNSPFNFVEPAENQLYVGWTEPGEWLKYTVDVRESGLYSVGLMYTSNRGGQISLSINELDVTGPIDIPSTFVQADTIAWRQWHHWNFVDGIADIQLSQGIQVLTLKTIAEGNMNYDYLIFTLKQQ
jgi:hypothetical protein